MKPAYRIVEVWWDDAFRQEGQPRAAELADDQFTCTVGYLVRETDASVTVAAEVLDGGELDDTFRSPTRIPRGMIREVRELRRVRARRAPRIGEKAST